MKKFLPPQPLLLPCPVLIIGSYDADGKPNIMNAAWGGIVCSQPPCVSISLREATLTYHNISTTGAYSVNFPSQQYVREADYVGMVSGYVIDKFSETRLTPMYGEKVNAPVVKEFPLALECQVKRQVRLGSHTMFIAEIVCMLCDEAILGQNGLPDIEKLKPIVWGSFGTMAYYGLGERLGNAFSSGKEMVSNSPHV